MLSLSEYLALDANALASGVRRGHFSCAEVTNCAIEQANKVNPALNAIIVENYEAALEQARLIDANPTLLKRSPLAGMPFLIKDLCAVAGLPLGYGSQLFEGFVATRNAPIAQRYLDAGLLVLGKTNTPEWGLTLTTEPVSKGITRNPWNTDYSTGGSSGGAAAAVAAGIVPVAHASDGGGSIRIPASCCGLFGLKPSRGLTSTEESLAESWSGMSVGHVVSQTVRDSAALLDVIKLDTAILFPKPAAPDSFLASLDGAPGKLKIALQSSHPFDVSIDTECKTAIDNAAQLCTSLGHDVEEIAQPLDYRPVVRAMTRLINVHVWQAVSTRMKQLDRTLLESEVESSTLVMAELGSKVTAEEYVMARDALHQAALAMADFHRRFDVILSPVLAKIPAKLGWLNMNSDNLREYGDRFKAYSGFTALYNGTGQPSMSVPLHRSANGLPVGVMFSAAWGEDTRLLQLAAQLEQAQPWPRHCATQD